MADKPIPRVFIAHDDGRFDFSDAERFGALVTVTESLTDSADLYPDTVDERMPGITARVENTLLFGVGRHKGFNCKHDYLCLVGNPIIQALCLLVLGRCLGAGRRIQILRFDSRARQYYAVTL